MSITVTITTARQLAGVEAAARLEGVSAEEYLQSVIEKAADSWADQYVVQTVTIPAERAKAIVDAKDAWNAANPAARIEDESDLAAKAVAFALQNGAEFAEFAKK